MALVKIWDKEIKGKLWAVGDIHGCHNLLLNRLNEIGFDFENDLLVAVGDLVDRDEFELENNKAIADTQALLAERFASLESDLWALEKS